VSLPTDAIEPRLTASSQNCYVTTQQNDHAGDAT